MPAMPLPTVLAAMFLILAPHAAAREKASVMYYPVTGSNAAAVYADINKKAPKIAPNATFAFTLIATKTDKKAAEAGGSCRYASFATSAAYVFHLPQHAKPQSLPRATLGRWNNFVAYLLAHEQGHRTLWRQCFSDYDVLSLALSAATCEELETASAQLFTEIKMRCVAQDEAYDVIFRKDVQREPFVAEALKQGGPLRK